MCVAISQDASFIVSGYGTGNPGIQLFQGRVTGIVGEGSDITRPPCTYSLSQNFTNPFNPSTTISFAIFGAAGIKEHVSLTIYDVRGRHVRSLIDSELEPGNHRIHWDGRNDRREVVSSGIYLYAS
ncbi:MAG: FlgD immunoglobulin-like domain containing protein [Candidatus Glassbacteria bacterium]